MSADIEHHPQLAHHFDDIGQQKSAITLGMWLFLAQEVMFFGGLFMAYLTYRTWYPEAFTAGSHHLDITLGGINTAVLILSSLTMALAVRAAQVGNRRAIVAFLAFTIVLGSVFLGIKVVEYSHKIHDHLVPGPHFSFEGPLARPVEIFFSLYFAMTGLHALHMVIGIGLLSVLVYLAAKGRFTPDYFSPVEISGLYWHFVDIVWIFLFPLLYLIGRN